MHTIIEKHLPKPYNYIINNDGLVWEAVTPPELRADKKDYKYTADIPDERLDHCSFKSFGYHHAWADTIDELIEDIKSFNVPYYSEKQFLNKLRKADKADKRDNMQVRLHWDGRGTIIKRGRLTYDNMTGYTSF